MKNTSYKDPSGFIFKHDNNIYRQINIRYKENYELLMSSGLYEELIEKKFLIPHSESNTKSGQNEEQLYKTIKPENIQYISYPYEWSFSQLKDAAILTLEIQKLALNKNMSLKDATAYNIQYKDGTPIFIDTLSFEKYNEGSPWVAYGQFCKHFLAPLSLMSYTNINLNQLLKTNMDGIPLDLTCDLLPTKAKLNPNLLMHLFLHANSQKKYENSTDLKSEKEIYVNKFSLEALIDSLLTCVKSLKFPKIKTEWGEYYTNTNYTELSSSEKYKIISGFIDSISDANIKTVCDLGANRGDYSRIAANKGIKTLAFDIDPVAVEENYRHVKKQKENNILPLLQDITNPSPGIGFMNEERENFSKRFGCDLAMALALVHHLAISNNLPFTNIADCFSQICSYLIIEFIPKTDSKVKILLSTREDIFPNYNLEGFECEFSKYFEIIEKKPITDSERTLYLMKRRSE